MFHLRELMIAAALACGLAACSQQDEVNPPPAAAPQADATQAAAAQPDAAAQLKDLMDRLTTDVLREAPELATSLAVSEELAGGRFANRLSDPSREGMMRQAKILRDYREELRAIDRVGLSPADAVTYDVLATYMDNTMASHKFDFGAIGFGPATPYVLTQLTGAYTFIPDFLDSQHRVETAQDAEDYVSRLQAYAGVLDSETALLEADAGKGVIPPDFAIDKAIEQLKTFASQPAAETVLVQSLKRKVADAKLDDAAQEDLVARAEAIVKDAVLPAYERQIAALTTLRPQASHDAGIKGRVPNAEEYYAIALRAFNTSTLTPDEIHEMGLKLIEQLHGEMDAILDAQGMTEGTVAERVKALAKDPDELYPNTDEGRAQVLAALNQQIADLEPLLPKYFGKLAKAKLEIKRVPPYVEAGAPGGYYQPPALDGSRPGAYYINLRNTAEWPKFTLPTLTYHEGNPGHHWQLAIAQESEGLHMLRGAMINNSGYAEGWGLYAEQLADEMGVYAEDPLGRLGYLQSMSFRAARLVADTGLHHKGWSREQTIEFMVGATGDQESSIATEVERYCVWPGQATAYMVGRQEINRLRADAQAALGERFDIRGFHDAVLTSGGVPLSVLERVVKTWVGQQQGSAGT
jgi:uncharacterized protein (DUF885 family)